MADCAVIPVPDEGAGEVPKAFVVRAADATTRPDKEVVEEIANAMAAVRSRQGVLQVDMPGADGGAVAMTVTRPHVTTPSTAKASHDRRKQPANFACPVPGCGSTFTRHFNLKGESSCAVWRARWR